MKVAILISEIGSNLNNILNSIDCGELGVKIECVVSSGKENEVLKRCQHLNIPTLILPKQKNEIKKNYEKKLSEFIKSYSFDFLILAGFMVILSEHFVNQFKNKMLNLHPSRLPKYKGLDCYKRVLASTDEVHGSTVHIVTEKIDDGSILAQSHIYISPIENQESLEKKNKLMEHFLFIRVLQLLCTKELVIKNNQVFYHNQWVGKSGLQL